ncbi:Plasmodium exported protein, unknown function [Plasmodium vivax]|uniref:Variable surface protein n=1 Tax=Plasmodium vivax TaxID=5855 RepID=A0A565A665_PLAVI|nr:Plasmodium exported protein, unknown function [Plasmodium vivax]
MKKNFIIKFFTFIFFIWIYQKYDDAVSFSKGLENIFNSKDSLYIAEYRLLVEKDLKTGLYDKKLEDNLLNDRDNGILKIDNYGSSVYKKLQKSCSNDLKIYKQQFKRKYARRKGLKRLDCYCEKKIFDMIDTLSEQPEGNSSNNIKLKKNIVRKWGIRFIVMCLIPLIGIILPILDQIDGSSKKSILKESEIPESVYIIYGIIFIILTYIILFSIIYTMRKVVKYHRLEAGRGKLNFREYCHFCKDIFFAFIYGILFIILTYIILFSIIYTMRKVVKYNGILKIDNYGSSVYKKLQKSCSNDLKIYKQQFKRKYARRKGLKRLDCYCEKKIFDMIDTLGEQPEGNSSNNIKLKKNIVRKWGIRFIVMCLIPLIGIILPILDQIDVSTKAGSDSTKNSILLESGIPESVCIIYCIIFIILTYIILFSIIYTMRKVVKYHRLEAGRGKLNFREYCHFCKDIFFA